MINKKDVAIIIPTLNTERNNYAREQCVTSLSESCFPMENVLVVFNGFSLSDVDQYNHQGEIFSFCDEMIMSVEKQGQCKAVNAAATTVNTPWIMVSNDDMVYPPDWFERLIAPIADGVDCISPQLVEPNDGAPTFVKHFCGGVGGDWNKQKFLEYVEKSKYYDTDDIMPLGLCRPGFNLPFLIKREIWNLVEGYDTNYDPWSSNSDSDFEYKLKLAGVNMWQNTNCPVYHFSQTSGTFHPDNRSYWQKNWDYFKEKWGFERIGSPEIWTTEFEIPYDKLKYKPKWAKLPGEEALRASKTGEN